jgi:hypothetical protein
MATRLACDGCSTDVPKHVHADDTHGDRATCTRCTLGHEAHVVGQYDRVAYCDDCKATWDAHVAAETAQRIAVVTAFEAWRADALAALKTNGLAALPDEG